MRFILISNSQIVTHLGYATRSVRLGLDVEQLVLLFEGSFLTRFFMADHSERNSRSLIQRPFKFFHSLGKVIHSHLRSIKFAHTEDVSGKWAILSRSEVPYSRARIRKKAGIMSMCAQPVSWNVMNLKDLRELLPGNYVPAIFSVFPHWENISLLLDIPIAMS